MLALSTSNGNFNMSFNSNDTQHILKKILGDENINNLFNNDVVMLNSSPKGISAILIETSATSKD